MLKKFEKDHISKKENKKLICMVTDSETAMYPNCKPHHTKLATVLEVLQMKENFKWSDHSVTKQLTFL
jgi:hypothetical protein